MKILNREDTLKELAAHEGKEYVILQNKEPVNKLLILFELDNMLMNNFVQFEREDKVIKIAINNIFDDELIEDIKYILAEHKLECKFYMAMRVSIRKFIKSKKSTMS